SGAGETTWGVQGAPPGRARRNAQQHHTRQGRQAGGGTHTRPTRGGTVPHPSVCRSSAQSPQGTRKTRHSQQPRPTDGEVKPWHGKQATEQADSRKTGPTSGAASSNKPTTNARHPPTTPGAPGSPPTSTTSNPATITRRQTFKRSPK